MSGSGMNERALLFTHAGQHFSLPASVGREAFVPPHLTPLPGGQGALLGLTEVRGLAVPLLDLSALSGDAMSTGVPRPNLPKLALLLEVGGELLALPAQDVIGLMTLSTDQQSTGLLSEPFQAGDLTVRRLNPSALLDAVRARLTTT